MDSFKLNFKAAEVIVFFAAIPWLWENGFAPDCSTSGSCMFRSLHYPIQLLYPVAVGITIKRALARYCRDPHLKQL